MTESTRPRIAVASSSNRPSNRLAAMPGKRIGVELSSVPAGVIEGLQSARPGLEIIDIAPDHPHAPPLQGS